MSCEFGNSENSESEHLCKWYTENRGDAGGDKKEASHPPSQVGAIKAFRASQAVAQRGRACAHIACFHCLAGRAAQRRRAASGQFPGLPLPKGAVGCGHLAREQTKDRDGRATRRRVCVCGHPLSAHGLGFLLHSKTAPPFTGAKQALRCTGLAYRLASLDRVSPMVGSSGPWKAFRLPSVNPGRYLAHARM